MKKQQLLEDINFISPQMGDYAGKNKLVVDREAGIIKNVKIIGFVSDNKRKYSPKSLKAAIPLYEGIKVNINHPAKPNDPRKAEDRFGKFVNVRFVEGEGLYGDLLYLKSHDMANSVCEAAERQELNDAFGMSHNAQGKGSVGKDGFFNVEEITEVRHVDLVADPATTKSLSESKSTGEQETTEAQYSGVYRASKRRAPGAKRGFVKSKSKLAKKATGKMKEEEDDKDEDEDEKELKEFKSELNSLISDSSVDGGTKVEDLIGLFWDESEVQTTSEGKKMSEEVKPDEKTVQALEEAKKVPALEKEIASLKAEKKIRDICESNGVKFEADLVEDLAGLDDSKLERQIKRLALNAKVEKPKAPGAKSEDLVEGKDESKIKFESADHFVNWISN